MTFTQEQLWKELNQKATGYHKDGTAYHNTISQSDYERLNKLDKAIVNGKNSVVGRQMNSYEIAREELLSRAYEASKNAPKVIRKEKKEFNPMVFALSGIATISAILTTLLLVF